MRSSSRSPSRVADGKSWPNPPCNSSEKTAEKFDDDGVTQGAGITVLAVAEWIVDVAVASDDAMAPENLQEVIRLERVVREGRTHGIRQANLVGQLLPDQVVAGSGQVQRPIVIAHHVEGADRHRMTFAVEHRVARLGRGRYVDRPFAVQGPQYADRFAILIQDCIDDRANRLRYFRRLRIFPGPRADVVPAPRLENVQDVAQEQQVDALDRTIPTIRPPRRPSGQVAKPFRENLKSARMDRGADCSIVQVQITNDNEHETPPPCAWTAFANEVAIIPLIGVLKCRT